MRMLGKAPGFTAAAALTLAVGIGANTAIFAVAWRLILEPLPFPGADRIVQVWESVGPDSTNPVAPGNYDDWRRESSSFDALAAYTHLRGFVDLSGHGEPEQLRARYVTGDYFAVFGVAPVAGRTLTEDDLRTAPSVVLTEGLWRRRFSSDPSVVGRAITLNGSQYIVASVMPAAFQTPDAAVDVWIGLTLPFDPDGHARAHYLGVVGRLKPSVTPREADADVKRIAATSATRYPASNARLSATVRTMQSERAPDLRSALPMLGGAAALVLLLACANLASLQFARAVARGRELAVRAALGATRARLLRQLITESLALALVGATIGTLSAAWLLAALGRLAPRGTGAGLPATLDLPVILCAVGLAAISALAFGIAPAWRATAGARGSLSPRGATPDRSASRIRHALVAAQVAVTLVLVVGATLLVTSLVKVLRVDPGFDPANVIAFDVSLPAQRYASYEQRAGFFAQVFERVRALPGVTAVCAINEVPFDSQGRMTYVPDGTSRAVSAQPRTVTPACFDVLRLRLLAGRTFDARETARVAVVSRQFAERAWSALDPVGRRVRVGTREGAVVEVVGVVEDARQGSLDGPRTAQVYEIMRDRTPFEPSRILVKSAVPREAIADALRGAVRAVDPQQPVARMRTLDELRSASLAGRRFQLTLVSLFALAALVLASTGIYGLLNQIVAQRRREIAVRLALGAPPASVVALVMRSAWITVVAGAALGVGGAIAASAVLRRIVFGVSATDPALYLGATLALMAIALGAAWLPARRAAGVDAITVLKGD
jgi:putative ABC transport system permease protein